MPEKGKTAMTTGFPADDGVGRGGWTLTLPRDIAGSFLPLMKVVCLIKWKQYLLSRVYFEDFFVRWGKLLPLFVLKDSQQQQYLVIFSFNKLGLMALTSHCLPW